MRISRIADFGRQLPGGESVDVNLSAVGSGRRSGQRLQLRLQLVGIVGERVQVFALDDERAGAVLRADVNRRRFFLDLDVLLLHLNLQRDVEFLRLTSDDLHVFFLVGRETLGVQR